MPSVHFTTGCWHYLILTCLTASNILIFLKVASLEGRKEGRKEIKKKRLRGKLTGR